MGLFNTLLRRQEKPLKLTIKDNYSCPQATILYGTKTGNSQMIAQQTQKYYSQCGLEAECLNMQKYDASRLPHEHNLLIVVSTDNEGELPPNARQFSRFLEHQNMPSLEKINFAICALGDSSYDQFCQAGKTIEKQLRNLNANPLIRRLDCDLDFRKPALQWIQNTFEIISGIKKSGDIPAEIKEPETLEATIGEQTMLSKGITEQPVFHVTIQPSQLPINYKSGDCIEIIPQNPSELVTKMINQLQLDKDFHVEDNIPLEEALKKKFELTRLSRPVVRRYAELFDISELKQLYDSKTRLRHYIKEHDVLDLLTDYPAEINAADLVNILQPLHSRYYSIASGNVAYPDQIDLTIKTVRFTNEERSYEGAGSVYLNEFLSEGNSLNYRVVPNEGFHLPDDKETPIIMIGVGTGIAPFRAFLQDLQKKNIKNKAWLLWGDKHEETDFIYKEELTQFYKNETLIQLDTVFSRDGAPKEYVQDRLVKHAELLTDWLNNGAHLYLCGHLQMGHDVKEVIHSILINHLNYSDEKAYQYVKQLKSDGRLHEDLY